ncbi:endonuclease/exonuclease/phosphatase family protein [Paenibacillus alvei]|uniref:endonuclease/exonuclease/phosphatase family protein n=1 Tax=Paenibacillus alvei TaxID=44250 RepID=UPI0013DACC8E|nr:endonuclease/exonuclease/phosphatase family protein [Paenibacillus alvei]NEZ44571.1 hypothetical protein [Paenibacillus alvei]
MLENRDNEGLQEIKNRVSMNVMTFNIWRGSTSLEKVAEAIRTVKADIVGIQEADGQLPALVQRLNYSYDEGHSILSRYPLHSAEHEELEVALERVVALSNIHLSHEPYGPYDIRDGLDVKAAAGNEE